MPEIADYSRLPSRPKVSVAMITYNHASFIEQAVRSVLDQRTNFPYEIVIGDDFSTDGTREKLIELQHDHPDRIRLLLHERNLGAAGRHNLVAVFAACRGEFTAILEGDDFWCAEAKLAEQVAALDNNETLSACFHDAWFMHQSTGSTIRYTPSKPGGLYVFEEILRFNSPTTCTLMFRRSLFPGFPPWIWELLVSDWPLNMILSQAGPLLHIHSPMSVYRIHGGGVWSRLNSVEKLKLEVGLYEVLLKAFAPPHHPLIKAALAERVFWVAKAAQESGDYLTAKAFLKRFLRNLAANRAIRLGEILRIVPKIVAPKLTSHLARVVRRTQGSANPDSK